MRRLLLSLALLLLFAQIALAEELITYAGGIDTIAQIDGGNYYASRYNAPPLGSTKTEIKKTTVKGVHEWTRWYAPDPAAVDIYMTGILYLWASSMSISGDSAQYRASIYDFNPSTGSSTLIAQSQWKSMANGSNETTIPFAAAYRLLAGRVIKMVMDYNASNGGGEVKLTVDETQSGAHLGWELSNGKSYALSNVVSTAAAYMPICFSAVQCSINANCDDGSAATQDLCENAGSCNASCSHAPVQGGTVACSSNAECNDNNAGTTDSCNNPGTESSYCSHTPIVNHFSDQNSGQTPAGNDACVIVCRSDSDCNDKNPITTDSCTGAGTCSSACSNQACTIACSANSDCDDSNPLTSDVCSGSGKCDASCSHSSCTPACSANADCDDGNPATKDVCAGAGRCSAICSHLEKCGNGIIDPGETECNCPDDVQKTCGGNAPSKCQEYACIGNNCQIVPKLGCCGNNICEQSEDYGSCPADCEPKKITVDVSDIDGRTYYLRGETARIKAVVTADGVPINSASVKISGSFGEKTFFNDGTHNDAREYDNIYTAFIPIGKEQAEGTIVAAVEAVVGRRKGYAAKTIAVKPALDLQLSTDKENYNLGDEIMITGVLRRRNNALQLPIDFNIVQERKTVLSKEIVPEADGSFRITYHTSLLDRQGKWAVNAFAIDENGNYAAIRKDLNFSSPEIKSFLSVEVQNAKEVYEKNSDLNLIVLVKRADGSLADGADVEILFPGLLPIKLSPLGTGLYALNAKVPINAPAGKQEIGFSAMKLDSGVLSGGNASVEIEIKAIEFKTEFLEPSSPIFQAGEEMPIRVRLTYPNGEPASRLDINATVNGKTVVLTAVAQGIYAGKYIVEEGDTGNVKISISAADAGNNFSSKETEIEVSGVSVLFYLRKYPLSIVLLVIAVVIGAFGTQRLLKARGNAKGLRKREAELIQLVKEVQLQYFKEASLDKKSYDRLMNQYETELSETRKKAAALESKLKQKKG
ncbi:MAG: hypothetical protein V1494_01630 [Candidatus Diapherotrites archaeon]